MRFVQKHAWAPNTFKAISSEWRTFKIYCAEAGIMTLPIPLYDILGLDEENLIVRVEPCVSVGEITR